jgi:hypothetical protein
MRSSRRRADPRVALRGGERRSRWTTARADLKITPGVVSPPLKITPGVVSPANLDRLLHHAITINIRSESYRLKARSRPVSSNLRTFQYRVGTLRWRSRRRQAGVGSVHCRSLGRTGCLLIAPRVRRTVFFETARLRSCKLRRPATATSLRHGGWLVVLNSWHGARDHAEWSRASRVQRRSPPHREDSDKFCRTAVSHTERSDQRRMSCTVCPARRRGCSAAGDRVYRMLTNCATSAAESARP